MAAHNAAFIQIQNTYIVQQNMMRRRKVFVPPPAAVAKVVKELIQAPPTADEVQLLTEVARDAEEHNLAPEQIRARLQETRLWPFVQLLARNEKRIFNSLMLLAVILTVYLMINPPPAEPPQVTVNVNVEPAPVDTDEIAEKVSKKLKEDGFCVVQDEAKQQPAKRPARKRPAPG
jgi:hypothetical protein